MAGDEAQVLETLGRGDRVLYNQKKTPLTVAERRGDEVLVEGPQGGEYLLFPAPDDPDIVLESRSGNREYASKVEELRVVGEWQETGEDEWQHSESGARIRLEKTDAGYWTLSVTGFDGEEPDTPLYGFLKKEHAVSDAEAFMADNPEG